MRETLRLKDCQTVRRKTKDARSAVVPADGLLLTALRGVALRRHFLYGIDVAALIDESCALRARFRL